MTLTVDGADVAAVRAFNRFYTGIMGFLDQGLLQSRHSLTEARVLFELAQADQTVSPEADVASLRGRLGIDAAHLSRILARFEAAGLVVRSRSTTDGRRQLIQLTDGGREAFRTLDTRSDRQADELLGRLGGDDRRRLLSAMTTIRDVLATDRPQPRAFVIRGLRPGDLGWVVERHGALYAEEYGWDRSFEALVATIVAEFGAGDDTADEAAWIAEADGRRVGCVFCVRKDAKTAQLRLLLVDPSVRGAGLGARLVEECLAFARAAGYRRIVLWTNDVLGAARRIYQRAGFTLIESERHRSFGHDLVGQYWKRDLTEASGEFTETSPTA